jgi:protein involved in polysaccharide export with SLBB domain
MTRSVLRSGRHLITAVMIILVLLGSQTAAASDERRAFEYDLLFPKSTEGLVPSVTTIGPEIAPAMEAPVDPVTYRVVPGDLFQLEVGGETDRAWRIAVSAEGKLILPAAKAIDVAGKTLADVGEEVRARLAHHFPHESVVLHLLQPGSFRVPVTGMVNNPSLQISRAFDRISFAIQAAGGPRPGGSLRRILLRGADGSARTVDLVRFAHLGDLEENPFLIPGSSIHIPPADQVVLVTGAVRGLQGATPIASPNVGSRFAEPPRMLFEWKDGDTIGFLLTRAGGLSEEATGQLVLLRDGSRTFYSVSDAEATPVQPSDILEVSMRERYVYVIGAVRWPGPYAHLPSLTAADYVQLAGGPSQIGRSGGWRVRLPDGTETKDIRSETYLPPGSTVTVPERWTHRISTLLGPISGVTALIISLVALRS